MAKAFYTALLLFCFTVSDYAQTLVNRSWLDSTGHPSVTLGLELAISDSTGLYTVGNTYILGDTEYVLFTKFDNSGAIVWQNQNSFYPKKAFATDLTLSHNNLYAAVTMWDSIHNKAKMVAVGMDAATGSGTFDQSYSSSTFTGYDVPTSIRVDSLGNIFLAGTEQVSDTEYEFTIIKFDTLGNTLFVAHYDSIGLNSGAVSISSVNGTGPVTVTGYSGNNYHSFDIVTCQFSPATGGLLNVSRVPNGTGGFISHPVAVCKDIIGNNYVVGAAENTGMDINFKIIKYDTLFQSVYTIVWGGSDSLNDEPSYMVPDHAGNLLIAGYTSHASGQIDLLLLKYRQSDGTLLWSRTINNSNASLIHIAKGNSVVTDANNNVYVTGQIYNGSNYDMITVAYDPSGYQLWEKVNTGGAGTDDIGLNVALDQAGNVYASGTAASATKTQYITMLYQQWTPTTCKDPLFCPTITYDFKNGQITHTGTDTFIEFDIYAKQSKPTLGFAGADIYFTYNTAAFGSNIVDSNTIVMSRGAIIADTNYVMHVNDTLLKSDVVSPGFGEVRLNIVAATDSNLFYIADTLRQLCHIKMKRKAAKVLGIGFDQFFMEGQSFFYHDSITPYVQVYTGGLMGLTNTDCSTDPVTITYGLSSAGVTYGNQMGFITFGVYGTVHGADVQYSGGLIYLDCGTSFTSIYIAQSPVLADTNYSVVSSGLGGSVMIFKITNGTSYYSGVLEDGQTTLLFTVKMGFDLYACSGQTLGISISDSTVTSDNANSTQYFDTAVVALVSFCSVAEDGSGVDDALCPPTTITDISSSAPTGCITAGSFDEVTITGNNFLNGATGVPTVLFDNADAGDAGTSNYVTTLPNDILSYSQTKIVLLIPSMAPLYSGTGWGVAGSGNCFVVSPAPVDQQTPATPVTVYIHFANSNARGTGTRSGGGSVADNGDPLFVYFPSENLTTQWVLDSTLFTRTGALDAATQMVGDVNCNLGTAYSVNQTAGIGEPVPTYNWVTTYIAVSPSISLGTDVLAATSPSLFSSCYFPGSSSPSVNNPTGMSVNSLKSCYIRICDDGTLGNPTSSLPNGKHWWFDANNPPPDDTYYDFATVILHELGHTVLLFHSNDQDVDTRVMYYCAPGTPSVRRTFANDPDDVQAALHMFALGGQLGQSCYSQSTINEPAAVSSFPLNCSAPSPTCGSVLIQGASNIATISGFNAFLYPNPTQSNVSVHINLTGYASISIELFDVMGQVIIAQKISANNPFDIPLDVANLSAGLYVVQIIADNGSNKTTTSLKLIKTN